MHETLAPPNTLAGRTNRVDLGPRLQALEDNLPTWSRSELPKRRHSRFGFTCNRMSRKGHTKSVGWHNQHGLLRLLEVCPCGGRRQVFDGQPEAAWNDINAALRDPHWSTND